MTEQVKEIERSGMEPEEWITQNAEAYRAAHPIDDDQPTRNQ